MQVMTTFLRVLPAALLVAVLLQGSGGQGSENEPADNKATSALIRPAIVGVAHIGLRTDNLDAARKFYTGVLGFEEPFMLDKPK
jgi:hypothetical protein